MKRVLDLTASLFSIVRRQQSYMALLNFVMLFTVFRKVQELHWYYFVVVLIVPIFVWFDDKYMRGREEDYSRRKSALFMKMDTDLEEIRRDIQAIKAAQERESDLRKAYNEMQLELRLLHDQADHRTSPTVH